MNKILLQQAHQELISAVEYYEEQQTGLGLRLLNEIEQHMQWILQNPYMPRVRDGGYRIVNLKVFPYYIAYIIREDILWILAIAHNHRRPEYWIDRKTEIKGNSFHNDA